LQKIDEKNACVEIELPGAKKEDINVRMSDEGFALKATKGDVEKSVQ